MSNLIASLDEEADQLIGAAPYERADGRAVYRAGHYGRGFATTFGQVALKILKFKGDEVRHRRHRAVQKALDQRGRRLSSRCT